MMREYKTLKALRRGEVVDFEGVGFRAVEGELAPGDTYIAERNTGPKLLTVKYVNDEEGYVVPVETAYVFDTWECVKVEMVDEAGQP